MISRRWWILLILTLPLLAPLPAPAMSASDRQGQATVIFGVSCYDVGKAALEGLPGVITVRSGWHNFMEVNTVVYDSSRITVERMEEALRKAGTYRKTFR